MILPQPLTIQRDLFVLPDGTYYNWKGHIDFMLFKRSLDGVTIEPLLEQRYNAGSRAVVTLMMAAYIEQFDPRTYGPRFFGHIKPFANALKTAGFYWIPIIYADEQVLKLGNDFLYQCADEFRGLYWILPSVCNEFQKNGCNPGDFTKPSGNLWSRGSSTGDVEPYRPGWDWKEWHSRRDWPKVLFGNDDGWYVKEGMNANGQMLDYPMPCISGEPIGFWDHDVPNRRSSDPNLAKVIGGTSIYFMRGANFMSEAGLRSDPWDSRTYECAVSFFKAINQ